MMGDMAATKVLADIPMARVGSFWDAYSGRQFALWSSPPALLREGHVELGTAIYPHPRHPDLPYLMVVDTVDEVAGLIRTVAHDREPPPTLYFHQEPTSWPPLM